MYVLQITPDGDCKGLWTEEIPLAELGELQVQRASKVEFDQTSQKWEVTLNGDSKPAFRHCSRAECIKWEVATLQAELLR